ncbi:MAG: MopE-related protein [Polyangiales bacterium]
MNPLRTLPYALCLTAFFALGCGRSALEVPDDPDANVPVDVPGDLGDTPDLPDAPDGDVPDGGCTNSAQCDDNVFCNGVESCVAGRCVAGSPPVCDDGVSCTRDRCDEARRACVAEADNTRCALPAVCDPVRDCTVVRCRADAECDNGNVCDGAERCSGGLCVTGAPLRCDDGVACTVDRCDPRGGCLNAPDDNRCSDGVFCNGAEVCVARVGCTAGRPLLCDTGDRCTAGVCSEAARGCVMSPRDNDRDGFGPISCPGGRDCDDANPRVNPAAPEVCNNGVDDNCDGLADCRDRACAGSPACGPCTPTGPEAAQCNDGRDNDCDGFTDCSDFDCRAAPACMMCIPTGPERDPMSCLDGRDNDCDGLSDCADPDCRFFPSCMMCVPTGPEAGRCNDGRDNDCNGAADCSDPACGMDPACRAPNDTCATATPIGLPGRASGSTTAANNDYTPTCAMSSAPDVAYVFRNPARQTVTIDTEGSSFDTMLQVFRADCSPANAIACDDDGGTGTASRLVLRDLEPGTYFVVVDGWGSSAGAFALTLSVGATEVCDNRVDDDGDGLVDCSDPDCRAAPACMMCIPTGPENVGMNCFDGVDNDCNGVADCADFACATIPACCRPTGLENNAMACADGRDNDCNGLTDCADPACASVPACCRPTSRVEAGTACFDGVDNDCDGQRDCADPDCATQPMCCRPTAPENTPAACRDGADNDCDGLTDCADPQCNGVPGCACVPSPEVCRDGVDNDCDGRTDCADSDCLTSPLCMMCVPTGAEVTDAACRDGVDNDCDGQIDCADTQCAAVPGCAPTPPNDTCAGALRLAVGSTVTGTTNGATNRYTPVVMGFPGCRGGAGGEVVYALTVARAATIMVDTVGSGFDTVLFVRRSPCEGGEQVACNDDAVGTQSRLTFAATPGVYYVFVDGFAANSRGAFTLNVSEVATPTEVCGNGVDDDGNGLTDCADPACAMDPTCRCVPTGAEVGGACADGRDNDCDGLTDCADPQCAAAPACCRPTGAENTPAACSDGRDNDCDGQTDCADTQCRSFPGCCMPNMPREFGVAACTDGVDNDCDGVADCADSDCQPFRGANAECCNGRDDNANGITDEFACACENSRQCAGVGNGGPFPSNTCWVNTFRVCAPRCDLLGGDTFCRTTFGGARCDTTTGECR